MRITLALLLSLGLMPAAANAQGRMVRADMSFNLVEGPKPLPKPLWLTPIDYPMAALHRNEQGIVGFEFTVGVDGKVSACRVSQSSGYPALDDAACRALNKKARFTPDKGPGGEPIASVAKATVNFTIGGQGTR